MIEDPDPQILSHPPMMPSLKIQAVICNISPLRFEQGYVG